MENMEKTPTVSNVTTSVISDFLAELAKSDIDAEVAERLSAVLKGTAKITETDLRSAMLQEKDHD
jgi:hypothetical protein